MHTLMLLYMGDETVTASAGTERVLTNMANAFVERGYRVIVVTNDPPTAKPYFPFLPQVKLVFLDVWQVKMPVSVKIKREINRVIPIMDRPVESYRAHLSVEKLKQRLSDCHIDCVIAYNHEAIQVADFWQRGNVPLIAMMHNSIRVIMGNSNRATLKEKEKADLIQVLMPSHIKEAQKYIHKTPIICIPNTVAAVPVDKQANLEEKRSRRTIITVGRIDEFQKQTHILIQAFNLVTDSYPDWQVEIWGEVKKKSYYEKLIQFVKAHRLEEKIRFCGTTQNIQEKLQQADVFAFPSAFEGFGLSLAEAMATGLPSVGFRSADAVGDLIVNGRNGILCEDGASAFAQGLECLMKDQDLRVRLGRQAVEDMKSYAPQIIWDKWQDVVEQQIRSFSHKKGK